MQYDIFAQLLPAQRRAKYGVLEMMVQREPEREPEREPLLTPICTIDEAIAILQAMKEGKQIQIMANGGWQDREASQKDKIPQFNMHKYRIRPEPRVFWANIYPGQKSSYMHDHEYDAKQRCCDDGETIKVVEVIE